MKLTCIYVENFGVLQGCRLEPGDGITQILRDNGTGKSTLAVFLQTMFYGFPRANKSLDKDLRRKYNPWQGGRYGGYIEFEQDGHSYRLERYFGDRPAQDTFTLYELNPLRLSSRFSQDIGIELFGLDAESWARSTYVPQQMLSASLGAPGVIAGLTSLVEDTDDVHRYDKAVQALRAKRSSLQPYRGQGGLIGRTQANILELTESCSRLLKEREELPSKLMEKEQRMQELASIDKELDEMQDRISYLSEAAWRSQVYQEYVRMNETSEKFQKELSELGKRYPYGFPEEEALEDAEATMQATDRTPLLQAQDTLAEDERILKDLDRRFSKGLPSEEELAGLSESYHGLLKDMDHLEDNSEKISQDHQKTITSKTAVNRTELLLVGATISLILGSVCFFLRQLMGGTICLALGIGVLLYVIYQSQKQKADADEEELLLTEQDPLRTSIEEKDAILSEGLSRYFDDTSMGEYHIQLQQLSQALTTVSEKTEEVRRLKQQIEEEKNREWKAQVHLQSFCRQYGIPLKTLSVRVLNQIRQDRLRYRELEDNYRRNAERLSGFLLDHGPDACVPVTADRNELGALKEKRGTTAIKKETLQRELAGLNERLRQMSMKADQLPELEDRLKEQQELLKTSKKEVFLLDETIRHLSAARETLSVSYLTRIRQSFIKYYRQLSTREQIDENIFLTTDLMLSVDCMGEARELASFSAGNTDLYMFCMRLALIDALFPEEKPILILDDPFVNLDEAHTQKALSFLCGIKDKQILYLTCHPGREIPCI